MFFDPVYFLFVLPPLVLSLWAQWRVKRVFNQYSKIGTARRMTGAEAARHVLDTGGAPEVRVEEVGGFLSDHYDPVKKVLRLSPDNYRNPSVAAIGVACHEAGHALQHKADYFPMWVRSMLVPVASFGSQAWWIVLMLGMFMQAFGLIKLAILIFAATVLFQVVNLPVEFDATRRAKLVMVNYGILEPDEARGAARVLDAAAWTYIASAAMAVLTLLYYLWRFGLLGRRDD